MREGLGVVRRMCDTYRLTHFVQLRRGEGNPYGSRVVGDITMTIHDANTREIAPNMHQLS